MITPACAFLPPRQTRASGAVRCSVLAIFSIMQKFLKACFGNEAFLLESASLLQICDQIASIRVIDDLLQRHF